MKKNLRKDEVAEELGISIKQITRLIEWGELRAFRIGKREIRISAAEVQAFQARQTSKFAMEIGLPLEKSRKK